MRGGVCAWLVEESPRPQAAAAGRRGVRRQLSNGGTEQVLWGEVTHIEIITTDEGPFLEGVF